MSVFNINQPIIIRLNTWIDLSQGITPRIRWKKPDGTTGYFAGSIEDGNKVYYKTNGTDIQVAGVWEFKASITIGGIEHFGEAVNKTFVVP